MSFHSEKIENFLSIYKANWQHIKNFDGCSHVELLRDEVDRNIFFTYSLWESEKHLNAYRESELFSKVWSRVKVLFNDKPQAWTVADVSL